MLGTAETVADIGCDHGKLSLAILKSGLAKRVIASDISEDSLLKARLLAKEAHMDSRLICRCSDGFSAYTQGEVNKATLLGMGGELIASILDKNIDLVRELELIVMQPMRGETELRGYLYNNGFCIKDESIVYDNGRYYQLISAKSGSPEPLPEGWPDGYWQFGPIALEKRDANLEKLMLYYVDIIEKKLERFKKNDSMDNAPAALVREVECTRKLLDLFLNAGDA